MGHKFGLLAWIGIFGWLGSCGNGDNTFSNAAYLKYCKIDSSKTGMALAAQYDECIGDYAQNTTAQIPSDEVDVRVTYLSTIDFYSARARLSEEEKWVQAYYTFVVEDVSEYAEMPSEITGIVPLKMKTKESIDKAFGFSNDNPHGICADVQQTIHDNVLHAILSAEERSKYLKEGRKLTFIPDDDQPPLDETTNPAGNGGVWLAKDPASQVVDEGETVSYSPPALYLESDDPTLPIGIDEGLKGVMYCKLFSHQLILHWMLEKSFEQDTPPVKPMTTEACVAPLSFEALHGSCVFYFAVADTYYCSDYTGYGFDEESAKRKCASRASNDTLTTEYSDKPCDQRLEELESKIPDFAGFQGLCIIHCQEEGEFLWNIYQENPEARCADYPFLSAEEKEAILSGKQEN